MKRHCAISINSVILFVLLNLCLWLSPPSASAGAPPASPWGFAPRAAPALADSDLVAFAAELEQIRQALKLPGLSAAIVQDQEIVWAQGFGFADVEKQVAATAETPYHLASVTKPIAATLLLQLVEEGRLSLDDPVSDYGIRLPEPGVTVRHLLTHTSSGTPGAAHIYDGNRYSLLARVFTVACGAPFGECLADRIVNPLGMAHTAANPAWSGSGWSGYLAAVGWRERYQQVPRVYQELAHPYQFNNAYENVPGAYPLHFSPAAGLLASVTDLAKFDIALDRDQMVRPETKAEMFAPALSNSSRPLIYGLGWYTQRYQGTRLIWHSGGWLPSVSALYLKVPDENLTLVLLANQYNLTRPYPLGEGDVLYSTPALAFYRRFVFPRRFGRRVPTVDWSAGETALLATLAQVTDLDARTLLEHELWSYRKLYASVGETAQAELLGDVQRLAFPEFGRSRWDPVATGTVGVPSEPRPAALQPAQISTLARLLLGWLLETACALLLLVVDLRRRAVLQRPGQLAWCPIVLLFGTIGLVAYLLARGWAVSARSRGRTSAWRRALGPSLYNATGSMVGLLLALLVLSVYFPTTQQGAIPALAAMFLVNWLLFEAPLASLERRRSYLAAVKNTLTGALITTFSVLLGALPATIYLTAGPFLDVAPNSPLFLIVLLLAGSAGAIPAYFYYLWSFQSARRRPGWRKFVAPAEG